MNLKEVPQKPRKSTLLFVSLCQQLGFVAI